MGRRFFEGGFKRVFRSDFLVGLGRMKECANKGQFLRAEVKGGKSGCVALIGLV